MVLYYVILFLVFITPVAAVATVWSVLCRRKARAMPYRKRVLRRTAGAAALAGAYTLIFIALFVSAGYYPALSALHAYEDGNEKIIFNNEASYGYWSEEKDILNLMWSNSPFPEAALKAYPIAYNDITVFTQRVQEERKDDQRKAVRKKIPRFLARMYQCATDARGFMAYYTENRYRGESLRVLYEEYRTRGDILDYGKLESIEFIVPEQEPREMLKAFFAGEFDTITPYVLEPITFEEWEYSRAMLYFEYRYRMSADREGWTEMFQ